MYIVFMGVAVFDRDGSGRIEVGELRYTLATLGERLPEQDLDEMLKAADRNKDGHVDIDGKSSQTDLN